MEIKLYLRMLRQGWWIVLLTMLVAVNVALIASYFSEPVYQASARYSVSPSATLIGTGQEVLNSLEALDKRSIIQTYAEFLNSQRIYEETYTGMGMSSDEISRYSRSTVVIPDANILDLTITGPDPLLVANLTNNTGQTAIMHIKQLYKVYDINVLDPATIPSVPIKPQPLRDGIVASILGLVLGAALAIMSEQIKVPLDAYRERASLDPVSNVFTRRYITNRLDEYSSRESSVAYSLGLVRLNVLRDIIDTLPSHVVQQLLREVTNIFKKELRGNDMVGRWNDYSFLLVLPNTSEAAAMRTTERIRKALLKPIELSNYGEVFYLDPSVSISEYQNGESVSEVADRAEYNLDHPRIVEEQAVSAS
jgi:diguanylate cyclase (GGDEF)-like protein